MALRKVRVESNPTDASVFWHTVYLGKTPVTVELNPSWETLTVCKGPEYDVVEFPITESDTYSIELEYIGSLDVEVCVYVAGTPAVGVFTRLDHYTGTVRYGNTNSEGKILFTGLGDTQYCKYSNKGYSIFTAPEGLVEKHTSLDNLPRAGVAKVDIHYVTCKQLGGVFCSYDKQCDPNHILETDDKFVCCDSIENCGAPPCLEGTHETLELCPDGTTEKRWRDCVNGEWIYDNQTCPGAPPEAVGDITKVTLDGKLLPESGTLDWLLNDDARVKVFFRNTGNVASAFHVWITDEDGATLCDVTTAEVPANGVERYVDCGSFAPDVIETKTLTIRIEP